MGSKAQEDADRSCSSDADCVWAQSAPSCVDACQTAAIVSKAGAKSVAAAVAELESGVCSRFEDAGCVYLASGCPQRAPADPVCNAGRCSALSGCALGPHRAATLLAKGLPALAEDCATDDDCTRRPHARTESASLAEPWSRGAGPCSRCSWPSKQRPLMSSPEARGAVCALVRPGAYCAMLGQGREHGGHEVRASAPRRVLRCRDRRAVGLRRGAAVRCGRSALGAGANTGGRLGLRRGAAAASRRRPC